MQIELKNYKLIDDDLLMELDMFLANEEDYAHGELSKSITNMRYRLQQLIPSIKLAEKCFDEGVWSKSESKFQDSSLNANEYKQSFLSSKIEL